MTIHIWATQYTRVQRQKIVPLRPSDSGFTEALRLVDEAIVRGILCHTNRTEPACSTLGSKGARPTAIKGVVHAAQQSEIV